MIKKFFYIYKKLKSTLFWLLNSLSLVILKVEVQGKYRINGRIYIRNSGKVIFGDKLLINSGYKYNTIGGQDYTSIVVGPNAVLDIKENVGISNASIFCSNRIVIENNVLIGGNCKIYDTDFHSIYLKDRLAVPEEGIKYKPVIIREGAFIGGSSIILKGVTIGKNAVIGAGSVVSKNIPSNEIWGGNPVVFIKKVSN
jgi:acetyltransferase-like isoleucine patch superfamily enzyme